VRIRLGMRTWLVISHVAVLLLPVSVLLVSGALSSDLRKQTTHDLLHQSDAIALLVAELVESARTADPDAGLAEVGNTLVDHLMVLKEKTLSGYRVVDHTGLVVATSNGLVEGVRLNDVEVRRALEGHTSTAVRPREPVTGLPLGGPSRMAAVRVFVAVPVELEGELVGAVVASRTPRAGVQALYTMLPDGLLRGFLLSAALTLSLALWFGWMLSRSLSLVSATATKLADGQFDALADLEPATSSRVSEVGRAAAAVRRTGARLAARIAYISEFASNVAHEFKTPLATLKGTLELLEDDPAMERDQVERFLANARRDVDRLERQVTGLLALARADEAHRIHRVDVAELATLVGERHPGVRVSTGHAGVVEGDPSQLEVALENLVRNAVKHGGTSVHVSGFGDAKWTGWRVVDDGPGISAANQARVFERFFTTNRARGGAGLGLALVRAICDAHGGDVAVESRPGETVFTVRLPRAPAP
jgi:signal transduction histidine kinase